MCRFKFCVKCPFPDLPFLHSFDFNDKFSLVMCCTVTVGPPCQVMSIANSTAITVSWSAPAGVITEYRLQCSGGNQIVNWIVKSSQLTTTLTGLLPYTNYSCNITAHNSVGGGPAATTSVTTKESSKQHPCTTSHE